MAPTIGLVISTGFGLVVAGMGLKFVKEGYDQRNRASRIAATDTTDIRNLRPGAVEVTGTARPVEGSTRHRAPISDVEAIASYVKVKKRTGDNWRTVHEDHRIDPFVVDDGTGEVRVEPTGEGRLNLDEREIEVEPTEEPPEDVKGFAEESGLVEEQGESMIESGSWLTARWQYWEGVLEPNEAVYVLGDAVADERKEGLARIGFGVFITLFGLAFLVLPLLGVGTWHI